jgi:hypothetical protein
MRSSDRPGNRAALVVKYVAALFLGEKIKGLEALDRCIYRVRPYHLVRPEHHTVEYPELLCEQQELPAMVFRSVVHPEHDARVRVHLRIRSHQSQRVLVEELARVHQVDLQPGIAHEHVLDKQRIAVMQAGRNQPNPRKSLPSTSFASHAASDDAELLTTPRTMLLSRSVLQVASKCASAVGGAIVPYRSGATK